MTMKLVAGQVAVVTGGASGIGFALCEAFGARGLSVVVADRNPTATAAAAKRLEALGIVVLGATVDVTDPVAVDDLAQQTLTRFGRVDVVCNNAGVVGPEAPTWEQDLRSWKWMIDITLMGVVHGVRTFTPILAERGTGHILNTASAGGFNPLPGMAPYAVSKAAVVALTDNLRSELRRWAPGVSATALCPGHVPTDLAANSRAASPMPTSEPEPLGVLGQATLDGRITSMTPAAVAVAALDGIERNLAHVFTHPDAGAPIRRHLERILAELPE